MKKNIVIAFLALIATVGMIKAQDPQPPELKFKVSQRQSYDTERYSDVWKAGDVVDFTIGGIRKFAKVPEKSEAFLNCNFGMRKLPKTK